MGTSFKSLNFMSDDWRKNCQYNKDKFLYILQNELYTDMICYIGRSRTPVRCHSLFLKINSRKFAEKVKHSVVNPKDGSCVIDLSSSDYEVEHFQMFLQFLYTENIDISVAQVLGVWRIAKDFEVSKLSEYCGLFLKEKIDASNAAQLYETAIDFDDETLQNHAMHFISRNIDKVFESKGFVHLKEGSIIQILQNFQVDPLIAFHNCLRWADEVCRKNFEEVNSSSLRNKLGSILPLIKFELLSAEEMFNHVIPFAVLTASMLTNISRKRSQGVRRRSRSSSLTSLQEPQLDSKMESLSVSSVTVDAPVPQQQLFHLIRFSSQVEGYWYNKEKLSFKLNRFAFLHGLGLFGDSRRQEGESSVKIKITDLEEAEVFGKINCSVKFPLETEDGVMDVNFQQPVAIYPNQYYSLRAEIKGNVTNFGVGGKEHYEIQISPKESVIISFFRESNYTVHQGQFPYLRFSITI